MKKEQSYRNVETLCLVQHAHCLFATGAAEDFPALRSSFVFLSLSSPCRSTAAAILDVPIPQLSQRRLLSRPDGWCQDRAIKRRKEAATAAVQAAVQARTLTSQLRLRFVWWCSAWGGLSLFRVSQLFCCWCFRVCLSMGVVVVTCLRLLNSYDDGLVRWPFRYFLSCGGTLLPLFSSLSSFDFTLIPLPSLLFLHLLDCVKIGVVFSLPLLVLGQSLERPPSSVFRAPKLLHGGDSVTSALLPNPPPPPTFSPTCFESWRSSVCRDTVTPQHCIELSPDIRTVLFSELRTARFSPMCPPGVC